MRAHAHGPRDNGSRLRNDARTGRVRDWVGLRVSLGRVGSETLGCLGLGLATAGPAGGVGLRAGWRRGTRGSVRGAAMGGAVVVGCLLRLLIEIAAAGWGQWRVAILESRIEWFEARAWRELAVCRLFPRCDAL